jgi:cell division septal protein FtsQ
MFGRNKTRNRRRRRQKVLEVKLSVGKRRRAQVKTASKIAGVLLALAMLFIGAWRGGEWLLQTSLYENQAFSVGTIDVKTDGIISAAQLRVWSGVREGDNLFGLDLIGVKRGLERHPHVKYAAVDRVLPGTLRLRVAERKPVAQVMLYRRDADGGFKRATYQLDVEGFVTQPLPGEAARKRRSWLPLLTGLDPRELLPGRTVNQPQVKTALELIGRFRQSPMAGLATLQQIDVSSSQTLQVSTWQGSRVTMSLRELDRQLLRWRLIHDYGKQHRRVPATMDLSIRNNLPVRWHEPPRAGNPNTSSHPPAASARRDSV